MYVREEIRGTTGQDISKMNDNFMNVFDKLFGNINYSDMDDKTKNKVNTQWLPFQGEGNCDKSYPMYIRFFVPPNVKKINKASINIATEHYRMDSSVAKSGGQMENVDISLSMGSATVGVASMSSPTVGVSSASGGSMTREVDYWGTGNIRVTAPLDFIYPNNDDMLNATETFDMPYGYGYVTSNDNRRTLGTIVMNGMMKGGNQITPYVDLNAFQHQHLLPSHSHTISVQPHSHNVEMQPHTHSAMGKVDIAPHEHTLNEGIKVSSSVPSNVGVYINDTLIIGALSGITSNTNIDISDKIKIGEWNIIKSTTSNLARVVLYGIVEMIVK